MHLHLVVKITARDYLEANFLHGGNRARLSYALATMFIVVVIRCLEGDFTDWLLWLLTLSLGVFSSGLFWIIWPVTVSRRTARIYAQTKELHWPYTMEITDDGVIISSPDHGEWKVSWADAHKWKSNDKIILVYLSDRMFRMFPRRWFTFDADYQDLKNLLLKTIGSPGKARTVK